MKTFTATYINKKGVIVSIEEIKPLGLQEMIEKTADGDKLHGALWTYAVSVAAEKQKENKILYDFCYSD